MEYEELMLKNIKSGRWSVETAVFLWNWRNPFVVPASKELEEIFKTKPK